MNVRLGFRLRAACSLVVVVALATAPSVARAQTAANQAAAEALFEEGRRLLAAGSLAEACPKFAESQRLDPGAGTLMNLAACYERAGQTASAWVTYKEAAIAAERSGRTEWAQKANERTATLGPSLSRIEVVVPESSRFEGLTLTRDGSPMGQGEWGVSIPVDPGTHVIEATAKGRAPWSTKVDVKPKGDKVSVAIPVLEPVKEEPKAVAVEPSLSPLPERRPADQTMRTTGLVLGGVGIVGIGAGAVLGLLAMGDASDAKPSCNADQSVCNDAGVAAYDSARSKALFSTIGFVAGSVLTAGGIALFVMAPRSTDAGTASRHGLRVGGVGSGVGVGYGATF